MRKHYIHINNCINNFSRQAITPKIGNAYYNKLNNYITPTSTINKSNKHKNNILITKKNFNNFNYNNNKYILENDNCHNKNSSLNNYSNILNLISKQNTNIKKNENKNKDEYNNYPYTHKKNVSLKKTQNEIKMIEIKLTSDIIKNKIKQLNEISNDNKYKNRNIINNTYMESENYKKIKNNDININQLNFNKYNLINKRIKERKIYKMRKIKINNTDSKKSLVRKRNIDFNFNENERFDIDTHTFYQTKKPNKISSNNSCLNKNIKLNSEQNKNKGFFKSNLLETDSERNIKSKIDNILEPKKRIKPINMKNMLDHTDIKKRHGLSISPSYLSKNKFKDNSNNYNYNNYNNNSNKNLFNENYKKKNFNDIINRSGHKSKSLNDKFLNHKKKIKDKNGELPQGFFDNYFINNYNIKNINNTNIYNSIEKQNNNNSKKEEDKKLYEEKNKYIFSNTQNINQLKKSFEIQKENKVVDLAFITNNNSKRNKMKQNNKNNSIINTVNFSFNPIKIIYDKEIFIPRNSNEIKNSNIIIQDKIHNNTNSNNINDKVDNSKNNNIVDNTKINNNQINNKNIFDEKNNKKNSIEKNNAPDKITSNVKPIIKDNKENNLIKVNKHLEEKNEKKGKILIDPNRLEEKAIILNKTIENDEKEKCEDNKKIQNNKNVVFDEIKTIIKYYQNDYIKKSFIFSDNNFKKIKHNYLPTKDHIQKLKKQNKPKSILLVKEDKNKIKNDKLNLALSKLNELISEENENINKNNENNKKQENKIDNNNKIPFIQKNINFIKTIEENYKKGINYKCLSKREMKLLKKKKKNMCYKFRDNPQNFFSEKLCDNIIKSYDFNMDDSDIMKINKKGLIKKKLGDIKIENEIENKLSNSFREEKRKKNLSFN